VAERAEQRFSGVVDGLGRFRADSEAYSALLHSLAGKRVHVEVRRERVTRTVEQNRLLWATYESAVAEGVELVELATGEPVFQTSEDVHAFAKMTPAGDDEPGRDQPTGDHHDVDHGRVQRVH